MSLQVSVDEGHALEVLDLLCRGRAIRIIPTQPLAEPRPELSHLAARRLAAAAVRLLAEGGRRERVVLRDGRRVRGRIWDPAMTAGFRLRFTAATEVVDGQGSSKRVRRQIRRIIKIADTDTGDWLVYALAFRHLARVDMPEEIREDFGRRLSLGSPLATLFALEDHLAEARVDLTDYLARLVDGPAVCLLECLEDLLVEQWTDQLTACMRAGGTTRAARHDAAAATLSAYLDAVGRARRLDLARPVIRALVRLLDGPWSGHPGEVVHRLHAGVTVATLTERDALRRSLARVVQLAERLVRQRDRMAAEAFGDPRYEEAQLFISACDELLRPHFARLDALVSALTGRLG
jgi:hypothetical protein